MIISFCINEVLSIAENAALMGIKMPAVIEKSLDILRDRSDPKEGDDERGDGA